MDKSSVQHRYNIEFERRTEITLPILGDLSSFFASLLPPADTSKINRDHTSSGPVPTQDDFISKGDTYINVQDDFSKGDTYMNVQDDFSKGDNYINVQDDFSKGDTYKNDSSKAGTCKNDSSKKPTSKKQSKKRSLTKSPPYKPLIPFQCGFNQQLTRGKYMDNPSFKKWLYLLCKSLVDFACEDGRKPLPMFMECETFYAGHHREIERPIDLRLIEVNIRSEKYQSEEEVVADFKGMFDDCRKYNAVGSIIYEDASRLEKVLMDRVEKLKPHRKKRKKKKHTHSAKAKKARKSTVIGTLYRPESDSDCQLLFQIPSRIVYGNIGKPSSTLCTEYDFFFCQGGFHVLQHVGEGEELLLSITATTFETFFYLCSLLPGNICTAMSKEDALLLFLMKMKLGLSFKCLGVIFDVLPPTSMQIFVALLQVLSTKTANFVFWPLKFHVSAALPVAFKECYPGTRAIVGCTKLKLETAMKVDYYSESHHQTSKPLFKFLIGVTPAGFISFKSKCYDESCFETYIVNDCGFLKLLEKGDVVLADDDFTAVDLESDHTFTIPPPQLDESHCRTQYTEDTRNRVKRCLQRIQTFRILDSIPVELFGYVDQIVHVSCALVNCLPPYENR